MNNPNQSNIFGSTTTTFDDNDQANIVQTLSPEMQGIIGSQMDFVSQGPAQLGQYNNPFLQGMMQQTGNALARTGGWGMSPDASQMGGFSGFNPQFNAQQPPPEQAQPAPMAQPTAQYQQDPMAATKPMSIESIKSNPQQAEQLAQGLMQIFQSRKGG